MSMLWRKLWADTRALALQTIALTLLIALGVMLFVGLYAAHQNISGSYQNVYDTGRLADASVLLDAGPEGLVDKARTIPHVRAAVGRLVRDGAIIQRGRKRERVRGRFVGCPRGSRPEINDPIMIKGRYPANADECVLEQQFARHTGYRVGDRVKCAFEQRRREFTIVGLCVSPEYIYPVPSKHEMWVARGTFGVVFIDEDRAREWFGLGRQITELHCLTDPGYDAEVLAKLEGIAHPYGVETSYVQDEQPSKRLLELDQQGFAQMSVFFPVLFLSAAGLSLYGALARIVRLQVTIIGTLRASGFGRGALLFQYVSQGTLVAAAGALPGIAIGHWMAVWMTDMYTEAIQLPIVTDPPRWGTMSVGLFMAACTGFLSSLLPARLAAKLPPAVAMRGDVESPHGTPTQETVMRVSRWASVLYRIPIRGIFRRASRTFLALAGIAGGASIIITTFGMHLSTMDAIDEFVTRARKYQLDVTLNHPAGLPLARAAVAAFPGSSMSRTAMLPIRVTGSWGSGEVLLHGLERGQKLMQVRSMAGEIIQLEPGSIWLPRQLAERMMVEPGDPVEVEWVRSTRRRRIGRTMRVAGLVDLAMGATAYAEYNDVRRSFADEAYPYAGFGAIVDCDETHVDPMKHMLERSDNVALVSTTADITKEIDEQMSLMFIFIGVLLSFGGVLSGAAIHGVATVSMLERTRELATLRSLGFSAARTAWLAAIELAVLGALGLCLGIPMGVKLNELFIGSFTTENWQFRAIMPWWVHVVTVVTVFGLVGFSSYLTKRRLATMDLAQATKARE